MENPEIRTEDEWKDSNLCDAVLQSIGELNRHHNLKQTKKCDIKGCSGNSLYMANPKEISQYLQNHPENNDRKKVETCLSKLKGNDLIEAHWSGGYLLR